MDITIAYTFLPQTDPDAALGSIATPSDSRFATTSATPACAGSPWAPEPAADRCRAPPARRRSRHHRTGAGDDPRSHRQGTYGAALTLATDDLQGVFDKLQAAGAEVIQEPMDQPYGVRDCAFRDPTGNLLRINQTP